NPYIGPAHGLANFYHCCCFSFGIAQAGGAGKALAEWVAHGEPEWDFWALDPRRYAGYATKSYVLARARVLYENEYAIAFPVNEWPAGRPAKTTALYDRLKAKGALFGARGGWERAAWFPRAGERAEPKPSFRRTNFHAAVGEECKAVREGVAMMDFGGFTKLMVEGAGAAAWLDRLICGRLPRPGHVNLAYMLNERGGIVSEFTITRLAENRFYLISAASAEWHDLDWLESHRPAGTAIRIENISAQLGSLVLAGPYARAVLAKVSDADLSNQAFPWLSVRDIEIGYARMLALRVNYVGELGWELHAPMEALSATYDRLWQAGEAHGIRDFGMYAMDSLRLEKCYRGWKQDMTHEYSPLTAGLERFVDLNRPDFIGKQALFAEACKGSREKLVPLVLAEAGDADAPPCASVFQGDARVGLVTSGGYGHALQRSLALAYIRSDLASPDTKVEIEILGERRRATVGREPLYDPTNARLRM
ncbi:MAG TPA: glycine cleavage T C-terminal barrel domain-containing protein, partial [Dongiaceae bacterium]|nr:glycine cleavage T C-terminal barrel domain-containing protein [Dongiaceae bacterium]